MILFLYKENAVYRKRFPLKFSFAFITPHIHVALQCCKTFCKSVQSRGRKGGSFLQLYNITGICAFILCEVHYSTLFSVSTHREGKPTTVLRSKKEVTFGQQNIRLSFLWNSARRGFALFFLCVPQMFIGSPLTNIGWILVLLCCCFWPVEHL